MTVIPDLSALPGLARPGRYRGYAYMGVFDGHDGDACATFLQHELHQALVPSAAREFPGTRWCPS